MSALVLLACLAGAPATFAWDIPEASAWVDVPGTLVVQGVPMKLKAVRSRWAPQSLLQHLADRFAAAGLFISSPRRQPQLLAQVQLTALDPQTLHTYTVILQPSPDRGTTLYLAEAAPAAPRPESSGELPVFPSARGRLTSSLEGARTVTYLAQAKRDEIFSFYAATLEGAGFARKAEGRWERDRVELRLTVKPEGSALRVLLWERTVTAEVP